MSAVWLSRSAHTVDSTPSAHITLVPLVSAKPSFAASVTGCKPARRSASAPVRCSPLYIASPSPMMGRLMCASGARSPLAPSDPFCGMSGCTPALSMSSSSWSVSSRTPE